MPDDEGKLLAGGLGKLGASAGRVGDSLAGHGGAVGAAGYLGGWLPAWLLPKNVHEIDMTLGGPLDEVASRVASLIRSIGRVVERTTTTDGNALVRGVVGAGTMNLNPTVLTVTIAASDNGGTKIHIRGAAKEGLIKQKAGQKAAERLASMLE